MNRYLPALRSLLAIVAGYLTIALGTTLTFETLLGGIGWTRSSAGELLVATVGAVLTGLVGGWVAARVAGRRPLWHALGVLIPLAADTIYVIRSGISVDPLWFDLGGSFTLMAACVLAGYLLERRRGARRPAAAAT